MLLVIFSGILLISAVPCIWLSDFVFYVRKELEEDGLVVREKDETAFNCVEYYLTDIGYTLRPVVDSMQKWGQEYKKYRKLQEKYGANIV